MSFFMSVKILPTQTIFHPLSTRAGISCVKILPRKIIKTPKPTSIPNPIYPPVLVEIIALLDKIELYLISVFKRKRLQ